LGRLASEIARRLEENINLNLPHTFDTGDYIVVVNAAKVKVTGNKAEGKKYFRHTGYPGGIRETTFVKMQRAIPRTCY